MMRRTFTYLGTVLAIGILCGCAAQLGGEPKVSSAARDYKIGVYYYPGWKNHLPNQDPFPWAKIKPFPEREPLLGWYPDGETAVMEQHLQMMKDYGIDFVAFDWYWIGTNETVLNHSLEAYFLTANRKNVPFALLWANHSPVPEDLSQWTKMVRYWIEHYLKRNEYLQFNGQPVVFIFDPQRLEENAKKFGSNSMNLLATAQKIARDEELSGIYFVGAALAKSPFPSGRAETMGYNALSAYNLNNVSIGNPFHRLSHSYAELNDVYRIDWEWMVANATLPYIIPMMSGWDRRPWGGSKDPEHDNSVSTPESFEAHLLTARDIMNNQPEKTLKIGVICCWNEFGEGSYIEPTKKWQFRYLEKVKSVFGR